VNFLEPLIRSLLIVALLALAGIAYLYFTQRSMIYFPGREAPSEVLLPDDARSIELHTRDGLRLAGWFLPPRNGPMPSQPGPAVLIFNGNAGDRSHRLPLAIALAERGYGVLLFDYRGYAGNPGSPSEEGLRADALAAAEALAAQPEVDSARIAYFGESLGAAVAGAAATERPPVALILRSPPPSMVEMGRHHYPYLPVVDPLLLDRFPLTEQIRELSVPLLILVAGTDEIVPAALSRRVFDAASEPKRWVVLTAADHNDPALLAGEELLAAVTAFLEEWQAA
jgi:fermentation-respiration switch protein FrsA (DUF1100 family)